MLWTVVDWQRPHALKRSASIESLAVRCRTDDLSRIAGMIESDDFGQDRIFPVRWRRTGAAILMLQRESVPDLDRRLLAAVPPETKETGH